MKSVIPTVIMAALLATADPRSASTASADPAGFGDGLRAGWNGLVVSLNALVIAIGFLLPWLAVAAVVVLIVRVARGARRRRRTDATADDA